MRQTYRSVYLEPTQVTNLNKLKEKGLFQEITRTTATSAK